MRVGVDAGGTFTDLVADDGRVAKVPSTPDDPARAVATAIATLGSGTPTVLAHGTTVATNALLERAGAPVALVTNQGFADVIEIARQARPSLYDAGRDRPPPPVPREWRLEVGGRLDAHGREITPVDPATVPALPAGVTAAAVCLLHADLNPAHEQAIAAVLRARGVTVTCSHEVSPEAREYERFVTTVLDARLAPHCRAYLEALATLAETVLVMTSAGGLVPVATAAARPADLLLSGPAGGVRAAAAVAAACGFPDAVSFDMGGTSTDVCLIEDLEPALTTEQHIAGLPNRTPQIEINSIGAGGGSVAWLDAGGALRVGPRSAGADPGPACYGRGGVEATITDANVVLGRAGTDVPLAGEIELDAERARQALARLGAGLPEVGDVAALADGVVRLAVARMVSAIKEISIARGHDPRDFALVAYGGAGPMHAALLADELDMTRVIVPPAPGNFSAFGSLISDLRRDYVRTRLLRTRGGGDAAVERLYAGLEREARADLGAEGVAPSAITLVRMLGMRYVGQSWELLVRWPDEMSDGTLAALEAAFHRAHEQRYGHATAREAEVVSLRLTAVGAVAKPTPPRWTVTGTPAQAERVRREVSFDRERQRVAVYRRERLPGGTPLSGPAIIEEMGATTVIPPGWSATVGPWGELVLTRQSP